MSQLWDSVTLISIHALRKESDSLAKGMRVIAQDFNPRSP